jgi:hypothetical protein
MPRKPSSPRRRPCGLRRLADGRYYACGSQRYRRGLGCGPGVYVPQAQVEAEVIEGLEGLVGLCADPQGFTRQMNQELRHLWETTTGHDRDAERKVREIDSKIANIRRAVEDGLSDAGWANERLGELLAERARIGEATARFGAAPQIDAKAALSYRADLGKVLVHGEMAERKKLVRAWVQEMKLAPERLEVEITYRLPEPVVNSVVARVVPPRRENLRSRLGGIMSLASYLTAPPRRQNIAHHARRGNREGRPDQLAGRCVGVSPVCW